MSGFGMGNEVAEWREPVVSATYAVIATEVLVVFPSGHVVFTVEAAPPIAAG